MAHANLRSDWVDGDLVFSTKADRTPVLTLSTEGVIVHSLVEGADGDDDINLSTIPITNQSSPAIWNDGGTLKVGSA